MTEIFDFNAEISRSPESPYAFENSADGMNAAGMLGGLAYAFCSNRCQALERLQQADLACPFMVTEHSQGEGDWNPEDPSLDMLGKIAENTWLHCVDDVKKGGEPVILLDLKVN